MASKKKTLRNSAGGLLLVVVFGLGFFAGQTAKLRASASLVAAGQPSGVDITRFWQAWQIADTGFYGHNSATDRVDGAIAGMIASLKDPYTVYLPKEANKLFQTDLSGSFSGIGAELSLINGLPTVVAPLPGSPAEKAGLKPKDVILKVDGATTENDNFDAVINRIRGPIGSTVTLNVVREGASQPIDVKVVRDTIELPNVKAEVAKAGSFTYGYVQLAQFMQDSDAKVADELAKFKARGIDHVVLDLRNDPGGYLDVAVGLASRLIDTSTKPEFKNTIVWQKDRDGKEQAYTTTQDPIYKNFKLVVLMDKGSASASEILAGALSDYGRAKLIGTVSFGKGSVQELKNLPDGSSVKLTVAKWLTPSQKEIDHVGITPDVAVEIPAAQDPASTDDIQRDKAVQVLQTL